MHSDTFISRRLRVRAGTTVHQYSRSRRGFSAAEMMLMLPAAIIAALQPAPDTEIEPRVYGVISHLWESD